jgi:lauroyl/myristoyl acyltransferase
VYIVWDGHGYAAHIEPAISYERAELRDRQARQRLTQQIMKAFEPIIRAHLDQWYHFVPVWGERATSRKMNRATTVPSEKL